MPQAQVAMIGDIWSSKAPPSHDIEILGVPVNGVGNYLIREVYPTLSPNYYVDSTTLLCHWWLKQSAGTHQTNPPSGAAIQLIPKLPSASLSSAIAALPLGQSNEFFGVSMAGLVGKCTCGVDTVGYGNHSDWCDKHKTESAKLTGETVQNVINKP